MGQFEMAEGYFMRGKNKMDEAKADLDKFHIAESISASQESIEFSIKCLFHYLKIKPRRDHRFIDADFLSLLKAIPESFSKELPRLYLLSKFWENFYTIAKYGLEELGAPADGLFSQSEAQLAYQHACQSYSAAYGIRDWIYRERKT